MASKNTDLSTAKVNKKDEFYTQLTDIEQELKHYHRLFIRNKHPEQPKGDS